MSHSKRGAQATAIGMICVLLGVISFEIDSGVAEQEANEKAATSWEKAERSPLIPYPETVTYTLAKMTAAIPVCRMAILMRIMPIHDI